MENTNQLLPEEVEQMTSLVEKYRKIYSHATRLGKQIEELQAEMIKVTAEMTYISGEENEFYKEVAARLNMEVEEARKIILEEIQQNINQMQN
jgi:dihydroxyacetone kinase DhaKLM complex PTS-EIIA-like component DhaM